MAFDKNLDKELFSEIAEFDMTRITVGVFAYNNGTPKLQLARENRNADGEWTFAKLGRMQKSEIEAVLPLIKKAMEKMDVPKD